MLPHRSPVNEMPMHCLLCPGGRRSGGSGIVLRSPGRVNELSNSSFNPRDGKAVKLSFGDPRKDPTIGLSSTATCGTLSKPPGWRSPGWPSPCRILNARAANADAEEDDCPPTRATRAVTADDPLSDASLNRRQLTSHVRVIPTRSEGHTSPVAKIPARAHASVRLSQWLCMRTVVV